MIVVQNKTMEMSQLKTYTLAVVTVLEIEEKLGTEP
jgi:hypothetical protein